MNKQLSFKFVFISVKRNLLPTRIKFLLSDGEPVLGCSRRNVRVTRKFDRNFHKRTTRILKVNDQHLKRISLLIAENDVLLSRA